MHEVLNRVRAKMAEQTASQFQAFHQLARALARGQVVKEMEVLATLDRTGKSPDDLEKAVSLHQERERLRQELATIPALQQRQREVSAAMKAAQQELEAAQKRFQEIAWPLQVEAEQLKQRTPNTEGIKARLVETCQDEELQGKFKKASRTGTGNGYSFAESRVRRQQGEIIQEVSKLLAAREYRKAAKAPSLDDETPQAIQAALDHRSGALNPPSAPVEDEPQQGPRLAEIEAEIVAW